jgi:hypothetical protein
VEAHRALEASVALLTITPVLDLLDRDLRLECDRRQIE